MDEIFARKDLIDSASLKRLCRPSNFQGALQAGSHLLALTVTGVLLQRTWGTAWAIPFFAAHGILLNFLYAGQHELSHWTVFETRWLNEWLGRLFGFVVFYPRTFDQVQHVAHHRFTQDWLRDGELARPRYTLASYLLWMSGVTYWYTRWRRILRFSIGLITEPYLPAQRHDEFKREARWHLAGYVLLASVSITLQTAVLLKLWILPMVAMKFVHQCQNTIEHLGMSHEPNVFENTRSTRTNALMRWACWQMQYHTAHHAFPGVPFHRLRELDQILVEKRGQPPQRMEYIRFQWAVIRAFTQGKGETDFPDNEIWIAGR